MQRLTRRDHPSATLSDDIVREKKNKVIAVLKIIQFLVQVDGFHVFYY